jgi:hypothetical protein
MALIVDARGLYAQADRAGPVHKAVVESFTVLPADAGPEDLA